MSSMGSTRQHVNSHLVAKILIPLVILGMTGSAINFLHRFCTANTRWLFLASIFFYFFLKRNLIRYLDFNFLLIFLFYALWCFLSSFWSEVPILSFMKSATFLILSISLIRLGIEWVKINDLKNIFNYLWMLAAASMLAGILGNYVANTKDVYTSIGNGQAITYQGLVYGANMFGFLIVMSLPIYIWKAYTQWSHKKSRIFYSTLIACSVYFIFLSFSRASILSLFFIFVLFLSSLDLNKKILLFLIIIIGSFCLTVLNPSIIDNVSANFNKYIFKGNTQSLFVSRKHNWQESYDAAEAGGWFGLGYGVSWGKSDFSLENGMKSYLYSREKGNSQLAIVEEIGIVGLIFYTILLSSIFAKLLKLYFRAQNRDQKVLVGLLTGVFLGMFVQSCFEAWWNSPGSQESIYFWLLIGVIRGLEIIVYQRRVNYVPFRIKAENRENMA